MIGPRTPLMPRAMALAWKQAPLRESPPKLEGWRIPPPDEPRRKGIRL